MALGKIQYGGNSMRIKYFLKTFFERNEIQFTYFPIEIIVLIATQTISIISIIFARQFHYLSIWTLRIENT